MGMAYRHAWELVDDLNQCFRSGVVLTGTGGAEGGGARLTPLGRELVARFRAMERGANAAMASDLAALESELARAPAKRGAPKESRARTRKARAKRATR
jgi:molybdate transport system regulatory protein